MTTLTKKKERNSSLELLRVVAMLMIIAHHFAVHGGFDFPTDSITGNRLWQQFIFMGGSLGNNIFVLISGYFLINSNGVMVSKIFNLWLKVFFYSVVIFAFFTLSGLRVFSWKEAIRYLLPITQDAWWFASTYFVLYLIHPYLNILLKSFSREEYKKFLALTCLYWSIIPTFLKTEFCGSNLVNFMCLYSIAGYIQLWGKDFENKNFIYYGIGLIGLNFLLVIFFDLIGIKISVFGRSATYFSGMMRPFTLLATLCLLCGFSSLEIKHNRLINILASATFGVYLIHDNNLVRYFLWHVVFKNASFQDSPYLIPYSIGVVILVYVVCTAIEILRSKIFKLFQSPLSFT